MNLLLPYNGEEPYVFISYSHKDKKQVLPIIEKMQKDGYRVWYDEGIDPGTEYAKSLATRIEGCSHFFALISKNYLESDFCLNELDFARDIKKPRLVIYLEDVKLPSELQLLHGRLQAIFYHRYAEIDSFYAKLYQTDKLVSCCGTTHNNENSSNLDDFESNPADFKIKNGVLEKYLGNESIVYIPNSVTCIGKYAFDECRSLDEVYIPNSVIEIDVGAFFGCVFLREVYIPSSVVRIGESAFYFCVSLQEVHISNSVTSIGRCAFEHCKRLHTVHLSRSTKVQPEAFKDCPCRTKLIYTD